MSGFLPSIDNLSGDVKDVHSILIVPVYGHHADDDGTENFPKLAESIEASAMKKLKPTRPVAAIKPKPSAILQFVNKIGNKGITEFDVVSLIQSLIRAIGQGHVTLVTFWNCGRQCS